MAERTILKAKHRVQIGRNAVKRARTSGSVPAVLYGAGEPQPIQLNTVEICRVLNTFSVDRMLVNLEVESEKGASKKSLALVQDVQHDPIRDTILHVDFKEVDESKKFHTEIAVNPVGESIGVKNGGLLDRVMHELRIECLPKDMPSHIDVDISSLDIGQSVHVRDIVPPQGVAILNAKDAIVFVVHAPTVAEEPKPADAAPQQPEVIREKKVEGEAAAEAPKKK